MMQAKIEQESHEEVTRKVVATQFERKPKLQIVWSALCNYQFGKCLREVHTVRKTNYFEAPFKRQMYKASHTLYARSDGLGAQ